MAWACPAHAPVFTRALLRGASAAGGVEAGCARAGAAVAHVSRTFFQGAFFSHLFQKCFCNVSLSVPNSKSRAAHSLPEATRDVPETLQPQVKLQAFGTRRRAIRRGA